MMTNGRDNDGRYSSNISRCGKRIDGNTHLKKALEPFVPPSPRGVTDAIDHRSSPTRSPHQESTDKWTATVDDEIANPAEGSPSSKDQVLSNIDYSGNTEWVSFTSDPVWSPNSPVASTPSIKLAPRFEREERAHIQDKCDEDCGDTKQSSNNLLVPRLDEGPDYKDQVYERRSAPRSPAQVVSPVRMNHHHQGPTYKNQVQEASPGRKADPRVYRVPVSPGVTAVHLPGNRSLEASTTVDSAVVQDMDTDDNDEESLRGNPALIKAVLVDSNAIPHAQEVKVENSMRKLCLSTVLILALVVTGVLAGLCWDGSCAAKGPENPGEAIGSEPIVDLALFPCGLDIEASCFVPNEYLPRGQPCDVWVPDTIPEITPCLFRPLGATLLFNGGSCEQSDNREDLNFTCRDFNGGPPVTTGSEAFVRVKGEGGNGSVVYEGLEVVGELFVLTSNGGILDDDLQVSVFTPDQDLLLQVIDNISLTCSSSLELMNRYGSVQVVEFFNAEQGKISAFATFSFAVDLSIEVSMSAVSGVNSTLTNLTAMTSFAGNTDLSDQVVGITVDSPNILLVTLTGTVDSSVLTNYTLDYFYEVVSNLDGSVCNGTDSSSFLFGVPTFDN